MRQDGDSRLRIGGAAPEQATALHRAGERRRGPLLWISRRRAIDAGVEAQHRARVPAIDLDQHGDRSTLSVAEQARPRAVLGQPRARDLQHRVGCIDAGTGRRRHQARRQLDDALDRRCVHGERFSSAPSPLKRR